MLVPNGNPPPGATGPGSADRHQGCATCAEADHLIRRFGIGAWFLAAVLTLWPAAAPAHDEAWTATDTVLELTFAAVTVVDWMQTVTFTQHMDGIPEFNPILGPRPSRARVNLLIPAGALAHAGVSLLLPSGPARTMWQSLTLVVEIANVGRTASMGIGLTVPWG